MTMGSSATIADVLGGVLALAYTVISVPCVVFSPVGLLTNYAACDTWMTRLGGSVGLSG